ncbi:MAG TPA: MBL fold metallo-hydrolase, partial [Candidatus Paceibacterota bacterium]|nr:MBL fold metallo-hydrolase [Candidatus Paceibacterota bacterium]
MNESAASASPRRRPQHARPRSRAQHSSTHKRPNGNRGHERPRGAKKTTKKTSRKRNGGRGQRRRSMTSPALKHRLATTDTKGPQLPEVTDENTIRVIPISGVEEIGRNMIVFESKDDIVVFDAGFQFVSEGSHAPGINYILPNTQYLEERKHKIRALVITHGHLDHIGGIPFVMERIGNPPI